MVPRLLGCYENFPEIVHAITRFTCRSPINKVQQEILRTLHRLNKEGFSLKDIATFSSSECEVSFEFGIADGIEFNYLDKEELNACLENTVKKALPALDFFCVVRYHIKKDGKRVPLKFDYHMLRFLFQNKNDLELFMYHQRGIRRVSVEELIKFITKHINEELSKNRLRPLEAKNPQAF